VRVQEALLVFCVVATFFSGSFSTVRLGRGSHICPELHRFGVGLVLH
jgi:hypothetical protein